MKVKVLVLAIGCAMMSFGGYAQKGVDSGTPFGHEYQDLVDEMTDVYKSQSGTNNIPEEYQTQIRQSVFDGLVQDAVLEKATAKLGLQITPEELFDMLVWMKRIIVSLLWRDLYLRLKPINAIIFAVLKLHYTHFSCRESS